MIAVILYFLLAIFLLITLALLLPVKIFLKAAGGDGQHIVADGRVMLFAGLLGGGGSYGPGGARITVYIDRWRVLDLSAAPLLHRTRKTKPAPEKKKPEREPKEHEERNRFFQERITGWRRKARKNSFLVKTAFRGMRRLLRVDRFVARIKLGLENPALTGQIVGIIHAVNGILPERFEIIPAWDFSRRVVYGDVDVRLTFRTHLLWIHLARGFRAHRKFLREQRPVPVDSLKAQEV